MTIRDRPPHDPTITDGLLIAATSIAVAILGTPELGPIALAIAAAGGITAAYIIHTAARRR